MLFGSNDDVNIRCSRRRTSGIRKPPEKTLTLNLDGQGFGIQVESFG